MWSALTIVLECFHLVSLLRILSRLIQENRFLQQNWLLSPASCNRQIKHNKIYKFHINSYSNILINGGNYKTTDIRKLTKLSAVNSGSSCTTQYGKSRTEMLFVKNKVNKCNLSAVHWHLLQTGVKLLLFKEALKVPILSCDVGHDVLVEELQNKGDAVGKHQVLSHVLKLRKTTYKDKIQLKKSFLKSK